MYLLPKLQVTSPRALYRKQPVDLCIVLRRMNRDLTGGIVGGGVVGTGSFHELSKFE